MQQPEAVFDLEAWLRNIPGDNVPSVGVSGVPPIVQAGESVLRQRAREVSPALLGTPALAELVRLMVEAMHQAPGVGLAAPQLGVPLRLFVAEDSEERIQMMPDEARRARARAALPLMVLINPAIVPLGEEQATFFEGCLSVRGYGALVPRYTAVRASGLDLVGRAVAYDLQGWPARIMQHELDHLNGTLYVDRMLTRSFANESELARLGALPLSDVMRDLVERPEPN